MNRGQTKLSFGPKKHCKDAVDIPLVQITAISRDQDVGERLTIQWSQSARHERLALHFDLDTETSRNVIVSMLSKITDKAQMQTSPLAEPRRSVSHPDSHQTVYFCLECSPAVLCF